MPARSSSSLALASGIDVPASKPLRDMDDADLVASVHDPRCLHEIYQRHSAAAAAAAGRLTGTSAADDVVQEVFLRLWRCPERFQPGRGTLRTFLLNEARGRSLDLLRSEAARRNRQWGDATARDRIPVDTETTALAHGIRDSVWSVVLGLPSGERQAVALAYFGGYSYREVAEALGQPAGTVKSRIRRGLGRIRAELESASTAAASSS